MKKIFISGIAGFLGSYLAEELIKEGYFVVGCDNLIGGYLDNVPAEAEFHQVDLNNYSKIVRITKNCEIVPL